MCLSTRNCAQPGQARLHVGEQRVRPAGDRRRATPAPRCGDCVRIDLLRRGDELVVQALQLGLAAREHLIERLVDVLVGGELLRRTRRAPMANSGLARGSRSFFSHSPKSASARVALAVDAAKRVVERRLLDARRTRATRRCAESRCCRPAPRAPARRRCAARRRGSCARWRAAPGSALRARSPTQALRARREVALDDEVDAVDRLVRGRRAGGGASRASRSTRRADDWICWRTVARSIASAGASARASTAAKRSVEGAQLVDPRRHRGCEKSCKRSS